LNAEHGSGECLCALSQAETAEHFETPVLLKGCCNNYDRGLGAAEHFETPVLLKGCCKKYDRGLSAKMTVQFEFATGLTNHHRQHISESDVRNNG